VTRHGVRRYEHRTPGDTAHRAPTCAAFLTRAAAYFAAHGIPRLLTDNAKNYRTSHAFQQSCVALGVRQKFTDPMPMDQRAASWPPNGPSAGSTPATTRTLSPSGPGWQATRHPTAAEAMTEYS
jgi:hypothetical protein